MNLLHFIKNFFKKEESNPVFKARVRRLKLPRPSVYNYRVTRAVKS